MHRARPLRRERVYDRGNNSTLMTNLCIRQDGNERGACRSDAKSPFPQSRADEIPPAPNRALTISRTVELIRDAGDNFGASFCRYRFLNQDIIALFIANKSEFD